MHSWLRRLACAVAIGAFLPIATVGCFGKFQLVRKVYDFNKRVDQDKWIQWFVFLILSIVPVYALATFIDVLFANSVEFWTGDNPITAEVGSKKVVRGPEGSMTFTRVAENTVSVEVAKDDGSLEHFTLMREPESLSAWDAEGRLLARVADVAGQPMLIGGAVAAR